MEYISQVVLTFVAAFAGALAQRNFDLLSRKPFVHMWRFVRNCAAWAGNVLSSIAASIARMWKYMRRVPVWDDLSCEEKAKLGWEHLIQERQDEVKWDDLSCEEKAKLGWEHLIQERQDEVKPFRLNGVRDHLRHFCLSKISERQLVQASFANKRFFDESEVEIGVESSEGLGFTLFFRGQSLRVPSIITLKSSKLAQRVGVGLRGEDDDLDWLPVCVRFFDEPGRIDNLRIAGFIRVREGEDEVVNLAPMSMNVETGKILWRFLGWDNLNLSDVLRGPAMNNSWNTFDEDNE